MQSYRIAKLDKKAGMGMTDAVSIIFFALIVVVFYLLLNAVDDGAVIEIKESTKNVDGQMSLLSILRSPVEVDDVTMTVAELIALSRSEHSKRILMESNLIDMLDKTYGTSKCSIVCIDGRQIHGSGCEPSSYRCSLTNVLIPTYSKDTIKVSIRTDQASLNSLIE
jgi:hypothetical protein